MDPLDKTVSQTPSSAGADQEKPVVLVTGYEGLIGKRLVPALRSRYRVAGLDQKRDDYHRDIDFWIEADLTDDASVAAGMQKLREGMGSHLASVIHLAAYYDFAGEDSPLYDELTVQGTARLLQQLQSFDVEQFIFSSSLLVMNSAKVGEKLTSTSPTHAEWAYPQSKLETEALIREQRGDIPALILRLAGAYDEMGHSPPITNQIQRIYEKQMESYFFPGNEECGQSFIHLDDCRDCLVAAVDRRHQLPPWKVLLIGEEDVMSYEELQDAIGEHLHGKAWPTIRIPASMAKAGAWVKEKLASGEGNQPFIKPWMIDIADQNYPIDMSEAREALAWSPKHTLRETLPRMLDSLQRNPRAFYQENNLGALETADPQ